MPRSADPSSPMPGARSAGRSAPPRGRGPALRELLRSPLQSAAFLARAWAAAIAVEGSLRAVGYKRTLAWIEAVPRRSPRRRRTSVLLGERLVRRAYGAHAFEGGCLPRSLVQYLLHRRDGTEARLVVGVRRPGTAPVSAANERGAPGIEAHAWVESAGAPSASTLESAPSGAEPFAPIFRTGESRRADT